MYSYYLKCNLIEKNSVTVSVLFVWPKRVRKCGFGAKLAIAIAKLQFKRTRIII